ncbi:hypothetical protein BDN71DRAFT_114216 [Pleurotus eryngii]|uniref:Uncharacterized protein n=1 Tax=Pleurotus eryngii TaxID=5323 RepID=A0A9P5ZSD9_PLEER|nr:hypothetical protein BDN71DRAFT_114216 [Pleurotus eryngii]
MYVSQLNALLRGLVTQVHVSLYSLQRREIQSRAEVVLQTFPPLRAVICTRGHSKVIASSILHEHVDDPVRPTIVYSTVHDQWRVPHTPQYFVAFLQIGPFCVQERNSRIVQLPPRHTYYCGRPTGLLRLLSIHIQ